MSFPTSLITTCHKQVYLKVEDRPTGGRQTNSRIENFSSALPYEQLSAPFGATGVCCAALRLSAQKQLTFPAAAELSLCPVFFIKKTPKKQVYVSNWQSWCHLITLQQSVAVVCSFFGTFFRAAN